MVPAASAQSSAVGPPSARCRTARRGPPPLGRVRPEVHDQLVHAHAAGDAERAAARPAPGPRALRVPEACRGTPSAYPEGDDPEHRVLRRGVRVRVGDAVPGRGPLDRRELGLERHRRHQAEAAVPAELRTGRQPVDRHARAARGRSARPGSSAWRRSSRGAAPRAARRPPRRAGPRPRTPRPGATVGCSGSSANAKCPQPDDLDRALRLGAQHARAGAAAPPASARCGPAPCRP